MWTVSLFENFSFEPRNGSAPSLDIFPPSFSFLLRLSWLLCCLRRFPMRRWNDEAKCFPVGAPTPLEGFFERGLMRFMFCFIFRLLLWFEINRLLSRDLRCFLRSPLQQPVFTVIAARIPLLETSSIKMLLSLLDFFLRRFDRFRIPVRCFFSPPTPRKKLSPFNENIGGSRLLGQSKQHRNRDRWTSDQSISRFSSFPRHGDHLMMSVGAFRRIMQCWMFSGRNESRRIVSTVESIRWNRHQNSFFSRDLFFSRWMAWNVFADGRVINCKMRNHFR